MSLNARPSILITGLSPDRINSNTRLRSAVAAGAKRSALFSKVDVQPVELLLAKADLPYDIVFAVGSGTSDTVPFERLRAKANASGAIVVFWTHEDPYEFDLNRRLIPYCDWMFTNEYSTLPYYQSERVAWLPLAADLRYLRPIRAGAERRVDLFFCGYGYPIRLHILELIAGALAASRELAFFGPNLSEAIGQFAFTQRLTTEEFAETCTHALLTLNIGRDLSIANDQFNIVAETPGPRTFDVALAGGPQLLFDDGLKIDKFYDRDREIILFDSVDDVAASIDRLRREPDLCTEIATAAQIRTQADHLYEHRIHTMMSTIGAAPFR